MDLKLLLDDKLVTVATFIVTIWQLIICHCRLKVISMEEVLKESKQLIVAEIVVRWASLYFKEVKSSILIKRICQLIWQKDAQLKLKVWRQSQILEVGVAVADREFTTKQVNNLNN